MTRKRTYTGLLWTVLLLAGCSGGRPATYGVECPTSSYMRSGVLTNLEGVDITTSGVLTLRSLSVEEITNGPPGIFLDGEVYNGSAETRCIPLADITIDGIATSGTVHGPPYSDSSLVYTCLAPGESGALSDIEWSSDGFGPVPSQIAVDFTSFAAAGEFSVQDRLITSGTIEGGGHRYFIVGSTQATSPVSSITVNFYGKNDFGLLEPWLDVSTLELAPGDRFDFTTDSISCRITSFVSYPEFVDHAGSSLAPNFESTPRQAAAREARRRSAALRERMAMVFGE